MSKKFFVLTAVIFSTQLRAQDTTVSRQLDEVIVTASRFPQKQDNTGKVLSVIDHQTLQLNAGKTVTEILITQVGLFVNGANNNQGTNQDVYLRGAGTGNTLVLIDGVPAGDPSQINNGFDLNNIAVAQIERIEILKGAQSTIWGSDAVAGVINIITKKPATKSISPSVLLAYGSYNTFRANTGLSGTNKKISYNVGYQYTGSKGFSSAHDSAGNQGFDNDRYKQHNVQASLGYTINDRLSANASYNHSSYKAGVDAGAFQDDYDNFITNQSNIGTIKLGYKLSKLQLHLSQTLVRAKRIFEDDSSSVGGFSKYARGTYNGHSAITELYGRYIFGSKLSLVSGLQYLDQNTDQDYLSISSFGPFKTALGDSAKATNTAAYSSLVLTGLSGFNMETGARINHHSVYGNNASYTINPSFNIDGNTLVFVNISSAFKIPSLYQLYSEYGNKQLQPETSVSYELGLQAFSNSRKNSFRVVGFKRDIKNLIIFYTDPVRFSSSYINRDAQHDYGVELESNIAIGKIGNWTNNFTYVDGEGLNDNVKIKNLYRRPNFTMNSVLTIEPLKGLIIMPSFRFVGTRLKGQYDAGPTQMPQYYTIDFYTSYTVANNIRIFVDLRNLTNQQYFDVVGYNSRRFNFMSGVSFIL